MSWLIKLTSSTVFVLINYLAAYVILKMHAFYKNFEYYRLVSVAEPDLVNGTIKSLLCKLKVLQLR